MTDLPLCCPGDPLPLARYRFTLRAEASLRLSGYPGSMLRGSFGHGLRSVSCITRQKSCDGCPLLATCQYPALFQPRPGPELAKRFPDIPAPYVIEVPLGTPRTLAPGDTFCFEMVLFGSAVRQLSTIILAWQRAAWHGLGKGQARATLDQVEWEAKPGAWQTVYHTTEGSITPHSATTPLPSDETWQEGKAVRIRLETPTRLQHHGKLCNSQQLTAPIVFRALQRKVALYAHSYLGVMPAHPGNLDSLTLEHDTTIYQWKRYSNRQQQLMALDGLVGTLTLQGELRSWLPWLWLGQYTHLGKNTSFGLGRYSLATTL